MFIGTHGPQAGTIQRVFPAHANFVETVNGVQVTYTPAQVAADVDKTCRAVMTQGISPMISPKPPVGWSITQWLPYLTAISNVVKQLLIDFPDLAVWFAVWHEPENDMLGPTYLKVHTWWRDQMNIQVANTRFFFGRIAMAYLWPVGQKVGSGPMAGIATTADPLSWVPADTKDAFYGIDAYSHTTVAQGGRLVDHPGFKRWALYQPGGWEKKLLICERGFDLPDADQLATLNDDYTYLKSIGALGYMPWLTTASGHNWPFGPKAFARLQEIAAIEDAPVITPPPPPPPPATYTQAELDAAVAAAKQAGYAQGNSAGAAQGMLDGATAALNDVAGYVANKLGVLKS